MSPGAMVPQTGLRGAGVLVLVIGPVEAGKRQIIEAAKSAYASNRAVLFTPRIRVGPQTTGKPAPGSISQVEFDDLRAGGAFAVTWRDGDKHFAIAASLDEEVEAGRVVVVDVSRKVVDALQRRFSRVHVVYITQKPDPQDDASTPGASDGDLLRSLWNAPTRARPSPVSVIDNSGALADAVVEFQLVLAGYASPGT